MKLYKRLLWQDPPEFIRQVISAGHEHGFVNNDHLIAISANTGTAMKDILDWMFAHAHWFPTVRVKDAETINLNYIVYVAAGCMPNHTTRATYTFVFNQDADPTGIKEPPFWWGDYTKVGWAVIILLSPLLVAGTAWQGIVRRLTPWQITAASITISAAFYATMWGLAFAVGFIVLLFFHEMGHWMVLHRHRIKASPPVFWPGLGAVISFEEMPKTAWQESTIGIGGPLIGMAAVVAVMIIGPWFGGTLWGPLVAVGLVLNLFNMVPVLPLDGGRILAVTHPRVTAILFVLFGAGILWVFNLSFVSIFIVVFGTLELKLTWKRRTSAEYRSGPRLQRAALIGIYILMIVGMGYMLSILEPSIPSKDLTLIGPALITLAELASSRLKK